MVPLGSTVSHLPPRFAYILGNYGHDRHARSQGGRQPASAKPPLYDLYILPDVGLSFDCTIFCLRGLSAVYSREVCVVVYRVRVILL